MRMQTTVEGDEYFVADEEIEINLLHAVRFPSADARISRITGSQRMPAINFQRGSKQVNTRCA